MFIQLFSESVLHDVVLLISYFLLWKCVRYIGSYMQLFQFFSYWNAIVLRSGFLMFDALSPSNIPLHLCRKSSLNITVCKKKSCMFVTEVLLLCVLFPSWCLRCSSAGGNRYVIPGSKVNVSFSCVVRLVVDRFSLYWVDFYVIVKGHASVEMTVCTTICYPAGVVKSAFCCEGFQVDSSWSHWSRNDISRVMTFRFQNLCCHTICEGVCKNNNLSLIWFILLRKGSSDCSVKVDSSGVYVLNKEFHLNSCRAFIVQK